MHHQSQPTSAKKRNPLILIGSGVLAIAVLVVCILLLINNTSGSSDENTGNVGTANRDRRDREENAYQQPDESENLTPAQVFEKNRDAVFQIIAESAEGWYAYGSGFIVCESGIAVTNHHVMDGANSATAVFYDGRTYDISGYYSYETGNDLAIIQVDGAGSTFQYVTIGDSDAVVVGDLVYAVGGPHGDPLTFTDGMVSRIAYEPIQFDIYTIAGMIQSTAAIYGGNSGGPLLDNNGNVIGINSAGHAIRPSVQWAVPANRVALPTAGDAVSPLPIGRPARDQWDGSISYLTQFPFIPDFQSISRNARLIIGGTADDVGFDLVLDIDETGIYHFDYAFYYDLAYNHWIRDTDLFDDSLIEQGFIWQGSQNVDADYYAFFFNPRHDVSVAYTYYRDYDALLIVIGNEDAYNILFSSGALPSQNELPEQTTPDPLLMGLWLWDEDSNYELYFGTDGRGERGFTTNRAMEVFYWGTADGDHLLIETDSKVESWTFTVTGNTLTIESRQIPGMVYSYIYSG